MINSFKLIKLIVTFNFNSFQFMFLNQLLKVVRGFGKLIREKLFIKNIKTILMINSLKLIQY